MKAHPTLETRGWCRTCGRAHVLPSEPALAAAHQLRTRLEQNRHLGPPNAGPADAAPTTDSLFGDARGKMFGVLVGYDRHRAALRTLQAFSGQYEKRWTLPGWCPPLFDADAWARTSVATEPRIKALTHEIADLSRGSSLRAALLRQRRELSQRLMREFHALYRIHNFRGAVGHLPDAMHGGSLANGVGDCCAPKLLNAAARLELEPVGIAEFYWGRPNSSATRRHGEFYPPCTSKCAPILGFGMCGIESR